MAVIDKINFIYIKKPNAYFHFIPNMFASMKRILQTIEIHVADYTL